jgi:hypothetical protein
MPDTRTHLANGVLHSSVTDHLRAECTGQELSRPAAASEPHSTGTYAAVSPKGLHLAIPKELFVALSDFIKTRKYPGSITIQFRSGEILGMESVAKKTYRK